jgi:Tfp pilus assembly protein PilO
MRSLRSQILWLNRLQWGMSIGVTVAILIFIFAGYRPAQQRLDDLHLQIQSKAREVDANQNKALNLPLLMMEVQQLDGQVRDYDRQFPRQANLGEFIREITQVSQQLALRDWKYQPGLPRRGDAYFELPIQMNFQGEFTNVFSFLTEVERLQRLTRVRKLAIRHKDTRTGIVEVEIVLHIYFSEGA